MPFWFNGGAGMGDFGTSPYDISAAGNYGLKKFDPTKSKAELANLAQGTISAGMNRGMQAGLASGDFNPEASAYYSSQSARDSYNKGMMGLNEAEYKSQFDLMNSLLGIDNAKLNREKLDWEKYVHEDDKPDPFMALLDAGLGLAGMFAKKGGLVKKRYYDNGGFINQGEQNTNPNIIHDKPVNLQAEEGEYVMPKDTVDFLGVDTMNAIKNIGHNNSMGQGTGQPQFYQTGQLAGNLLKRVLGSLGGNDEGGGGSPMNVMQRNVQTRPQLYPDGGLVDSNFNPITNQEMPNPASTMTEEEYGNWLRQKYMQKFGVLPATQSVNTYGVDNGGFRGGYESIGQMEKALGFNNLLHRGDNFAVYKNPDFTENVPLAGLDNILKQFRGVSSAPQQQGQQGADLNNNGVPDNMEKSITIKLTPKGMLGK